MPGLKRHREVNYESDGSQSTSGSSGSSLDHNNNKRPRLSTDAPSYDPDRSDETTDEETQNLQASQFHESQKRKQKEKNSPAENGIIESVTCTNFMCHSFLKVDIGPLINFIIGHNGSGKSAVLTALTICLGGKASATNRGGSLKEFVKSGEESCTLSVKIKNAGDTGYQPDTYGNSIIVERTFNKAGSSGFKLKSSAGRLTSTRKADLEDIIDYYALQLDNPISVLTQDMARQFLSNSTPELKYKLFVQGVQLEQLHQDYDLLTESIDTIERTFDDKRSQLSALESKMNSAQRLLNIVKQQDNLRAKMTELRNEMAWCQVQDQENYLREQDAGVQETEKAVTVAQREVDQLSSAYDDAVRDDEGADESLSALRSESSPIEDERKQQEEIYKNAKTETHTAQSETRTIGGSISAEKKKMDKLESLIEEEQKRIDEINGGANTKRLAELNDLKREHSEAKAAIQEHAEKLPQLQNAQKAAQEGPKKHEQLKEKKKSELTQAQDSLKQLRTDQGSQKQGYPAGMDRLIKAIHQDQSFQENPLGPIGNHVFLEKVLWSSILERSLGGTLNSFIVTSKRDQGILSGIMKRVNCSCPILIGSNQSFDFSKHEPEGRFDTALRVLKIDHPLVLRQLIINHNIEQTVLIESLEEARNIMDESRLQNVKQVFSINPKKAGAGVRFTYGAEGGMNSNPIEPYRETRMRADMREKINHQSQLTKRCEDELKDLNAEQRRLQTIVNEADRALSQYRDVTNQLKIKEQRAADKVENLQDAIDKARIEEGNIDHLKAELEKAKQAKDHYERTYQAAILKKDELHSQTARELVKLNEIDARLAEFSSRIDEATKARHDARDARGAALQRKNGIIDRLDHEKAKNATTKQRRDVQAALVVEFRRKANEICPRVAVNPRDTTDSLEKKLDKLDKDVRERERRAGGDKEKLSADLAKAAGAHDSAVRQVKIDEFLAQLLKQTLVERKFRWDQFKRRITARARVMFTHLLSERSFRGRLAISHKERLLNLNVQPDETQKDGQGRQTKTLSGGEKSFTQICLLLALWEAIGAPIRCLDEFDVFMDSVNRHITMSLLIRAARDSVSRQFIFITPQSMASIDRESDVKVIKMRDPERNQSRLNIEAA